MWIDHSMDAPHKAAASAMPAKIHPIVFLGLLETMSDPTTAYTIDTAVATTMKIHSEPRDRRIGVEAREIAATANRMRSAAIIARDRRRAVGLVIGVSGPPGRSDPCSRRLTR
jgi:hypothetical protein